MIYMGVKTDVVDRCNNGGQKPKEIMLGEREAKNGSLNV